jgi:hypothetical protein
VDEDGSPAGEALAELHRRGLLGPGPAGRGRREGGGRTPTSTHWWLPAASALVIGGGIAGVRRVGAKAAILAGLLSGLGFGAAGVGVRVLNGAGPIAPGALLTDPALYAILTSKVRFGAVPTSKAFSPE